MLWYEDDGKPLIGYLDEKDLKTILFLKAKVS